MFEELSRVLGLDGFAVRAVCDRRTYQKGLISSDFWKPLTDANRRAPPYHQPRARAVITELVFPANRPLSAWG